eukprot:CAMPEP_0195511020 /NCGR_PEP_ID=MMETSP0794_2-20130614/3485_1 /TAXON_ID=515487 /ORGANISM="Stephanopyxis turris, Strain CCMP 815" /LENGTH=293 /DNA_ID=CAMNT_0040638551 /DNA_START=164 /DNA_END=1046 /DNA_ORIENTATION=+
MSIFSTTPRGFHGDYDNKYGGSYTKTSKRDQQETSHLGPGSYDPHPVASDKTLFVYNSPRAEANRAIVQRRLRESGQKKEISQRTGYLTHIMAPNGNIVYAGCSDAASFRQGQNGSSQDDVHEDMRRGPGSYDVSGTMIHKSFNARVATPDRFYRSPSRAWSESGSSRPLEDKKAAALRETARGRRRLRRGGMRITMPPGHLSAAMTAVPLKLPRLDDRRGAGAGTGTGTGTTEYSTTRPLSTPERALTAPQPRAPRDRVTRRVTDAFADKARLFGMSTAQWTLFSRADTLFE